MSNNASSRKPNTEQTSPLVIDFVAGDKIKAGEAARIERVSPCAIARRIVRGVKRQDGVRVHLEGIRLGHSLYTSRAAIARFWQALADGMPTHERTRNIRTPSQRRREHDIAMAELESKGIV